MPNSQVKERPMSLPNPATLSDQAINEMSRVELVQTIVLGNIPFVDESRLTLQDTDTLRRLAFFARQSCTC